MDDDLGSNPLYMALLRQFGHQFDVACRMSYVIAIPSAHCLDDLDIDLFVVNSHILMPSRLLKMHYKPLQAGFVDDIELDGKMLICHLGKGGSSSGQRVVVNILAEEIGYSANNKHYKIILIDRPLVEVEAKLNLSAGFLTPRFGSRRYVRVKPPKSLVDHNDCLDYLRQISPKLTTNLDADIDRLRSHYMILAEYLQDASDRMRALADSYLDSYLKCLESRAKGATIYDSVERAIRLSVENRIVHLMHDKLMFALQSHYANLDQALAEKIHQICQSRLNVCDLGAQSAFATFRLNEQLLDELRGLATLQSPLAIVTSLVQSANLINDALNQSVRSRYLMGETSLCDKKVTICSDDLIASFVYALVEAKPIRLFSISKYLETFGWTSTEKEQAAYYSATFQIVVHYILGHQSPKMATYNRNKAESTREANAVNYVEQANVKSSTICLPSSQLVDSLDSSASTISSSTTGDSLQHRSLNDWELSSPGELV